jgi:hypothetical protein
MGLFFINKKKGRKRERKKERKTISTHLANVQVAFNNYYTKIFKLLFNVSSETKKESHFLPKPAEVLWWGMLGVVW